MLKTNKQYKDFGCQEQQDERFLNMNSYEDIEKKYLSEVEKGFTPTVESCFDVLLKERGWSWADAYNQIGLHKSQASLIRRGIIIPPLWLRIKIAKIFGVDTSVIWRTPNIISADKIGGNQNVA